MAHEHLLYAHHAIVGIFVFLLYIIHLQFSSQFAELTQQET